MTARQRPGRRTISLDEYTLSVLREHLAMLDEEREARRSDYPTHGKLFCWKDGRPLHPDSITSRFSRLVDKSSLPKITLHGVRHSYATVAMDAGENPKTLSERIGHASVSFTMQIYVQRSAGRDKTLADSGALDRQERNPVGAGIDVREVRQSAMTRHLSALRPT